MTFIESIVGQISFTTLLDIGITALLIYWLFSLIQGTRAVRLVIGVAVLILVYALAQLLDLRLLSQILQTGAVVGLFALVVIFQPELRRALERIGRVGSLGWLVSPGEARAAERVAGTVAAAAARLAAQRAGALVVIERETGLGEYAETGVPLDAELSVDLLCTIFVPRTPLHDGAVIVRGERIVAAGATLPLAELTVQPERIGTRHRAALGITEQTDAVVVVVSEETGRMSLVERARIVRNLDEGGLASALAALLRPGGGRSAGGVLAGRARTVSFSQARFQAIPGRGGRPAPVPDDEPEAPSGTTPEEPATATVGGGTG
ncbi:MAG: diadenylate cyclase CdaA [Chloroflexi bacterium]|jgi:diadenylate cyclase|nr:diadenylate cyclase CdaA [Chloroflexota bacterium]